MIAAEVRPGLVPSHITRRSSYGDGGDLPAGEGMMVIHDESCNLQNILNSA